MQSETETVDDPPKVRIQPVTTTTAVHSDEATLRYWDTIVANVPGSDVTQLSGWVPVRREAGYSALHVFAWQGAQIVGGAQVLLRSVPLLGRIGYVAYGPLVASGAPRDDVVTALADGLDRLARHQLRALFVQPVEGDDISHALLARGFRTSAAGVSPASTVRVDLSPSEAELRAGLSKRVRRWTGKWEQSGVTVRRGGAEDVDLLSDLISRSAAHQGFEELSPEYVRTLYRQFDGTGHAEIFVGEVDGKPVAAELFTASGGVLRCRLTGLDRSSPAIRLSVTSALDWQAMLWAKRSGFREFDLGGLSPAAAEVIRTDGFSSPALEGPNRFKVGFGGRLHTYPQGVELISSPIVRFAYDMLRSGTAGRKVVDWVRQWMRKGGGPRLCQTST